MDTEEARRHLLGLAQAAIDFAHVVVGVRAGLFERIASYGSTGATPLELAKETEYFEDYVRVWCETAYAIQLLDHVGDGRFRLAEGFAEILVENTQTTEVSRVLLRELFIRERLEHPEFMRTGAVRTYQDHDEELSQLVAALSGSPAAARDRVEHVFGRIPEATQKLHAEARVLDVGCGNGGMLQFLAQEFSGTTGVGVDIVDAAVEAGRREIEAKGLGSCLYLRRLGSQDLDYTEEFDIVWLNLVMHELRADIRPRAVRNMWKALRPGGILISYDFYYPGRLEDFRKPEHQMAVGDQATEVVWGNRHLSQAQLVDLFASAGFHRSEFHVVQLPRLPAPGLVAVAFR